jgi:DNA ligase-associated metallophosphoesterase
VADLHWGKAAAFRAGHIPVPAGTTTADLDRLTAALAHTGATRLVVLGDLWHSRAGRHTGTLATIGAWRARHPTLAIDLVRGNHDRHAGDPPAALAIACHDPPLALGPLQLVHEPTEPPSPGAPYQVGGHFHPSVTMTGPGRQRLRLPCFVVGPHRALLPAFGSFTGGGMHQPRPGDRHFAIADDEVLAVD